MHNSQPSKLQADMKQFGFWGFLKRIVKFFLRKIGINYNTYYYMVNHIDAEARRKQFEATHLPEIKILKYEDFEKGDKRVFNERKLALIRQRLKDESFKAFGIIENNSLIYSCWISLKKMETSDACVVGELDNNEGLLIDAYCSPVARGRGLHGAMNAYRLWQIAQNDKTHAVAIVIKENTPAYKSQVKVGFKTVFTYFVVTTWGKSYTNYFKKKQNYRNNESKRV